MRFRIQQLKSLKSLVTELSVGLRDLAFDDNFTSFEVEVTIAATSEVTIRNQLTQLPKRVINLGQLGNGLITKSPNNAWTDTQLYMYNQGAAEVTVKLLFIK